MEAFIVNPTMYIQDGKLWNYITALCAYEKLKKEMIWRDTLRVIANNLEGSEVYSLWQWGEYNDKKIDLLARGILNAALDEAERQEEPRKQETVSSDAASVVIEGAYESVYSAKRHYVEGVGGDGRGFGMQVREGHPPTVWTDDEVMRGSVEEDNDNEKPVDGHLELMVLTSENGWPYTKFNTKESCDIYVNKEVMRVWRIIRTRLDECFGNTVNANVELTPYVLMEMRGIGKSFAAGSFLLYQLLHYNAEELPVVVYFICGGAYLFERTVMVVEE